MRPSLFPLSALALLVTSAFSAQVIAQSTTVKGLVLDNSGQPVEHARVHVHGRQQYVYADQEGRFTIQAPADAELHISAKGFGDQFVKITGTELKIELQAGGLERIVVAASGLHHYDLEMANPVSVLSGEELSRKTAPTIGETLKSMPGVHSNYYGPVAASPVLRGLDGPRVRILSNGLDSADVSRIGPDHAISADAITTEQIEVLRGPSTLLYGSGAVGGVVNVVDNRLPRQLRPASTVVESRYGTASDEKTAALAHDGGQDQIAWHFDGFKRKTDNYEVPDFTNDEGETLNQLENSWLDNSAVNGGLSWITDKGLLGFSIGHIDSQYGIPGHHHHHEEHEEEEAEPEDHAEQSHAEAGVFAKVKQDRYGLAGELYKPFSGIETLSFSSALTRYQHDEIEDGAIGTTFNNDSFEGRFTAEHESFAGWHGVVGYHLQNSDYQAIGEEAFTPDTKTHAQALFVLEERSFGDFTAQLGARIEQVDYKASGIEFEHHHDEEAEEHSSENVKNDFTAASLSAGLVWNFQSGYNWALSVSRSERAPSAAELYSNGAHIATQTYELGLAYALDADGEISQSDSEFNKEIANNIDLTLRKFEGDFSFTFNLFYNKVHNYLYMRDSGLTMADLEVHEEETHEEEADHAHEGEDLSIFHYQQQDATLYGAEFALAYQLTTEQQLEFFVDSVRAKLDKGGNLPRIPPVKVGAGYSYSAQDWSANIDWTHYMKQNRVAADESTTGSYQILDLGLSYYFNLNELDLTAFAKVNNLTDELGFVHSSFIKEDAPLPGRSFTLGLKARF